MILIKLFTKWQLGVSVSLTSAAGSVRKSFAARVQ